MAAVEILVGVLGRPLAGWVAGRVFGEGSLAGEIFKSAAEVAQGKFDDRRKERTAARKIEDLADSVLEGLGQFADHEGLEAEYVEQVAKDIVVAMRTLDLGDAIVHAGRDPGKLAPVLFDALPRGADRGDSATGLMVTTFADGLCRIANDLPEYQRGKDEVLFADLDRLISGQEAVARDLSVVRQETEALRLGWQTERRERHAAADQNEQQYRNELRRFASQVKLLGLEGDKSGPGRELPIDTAYVPLRLRSRGEDGSGEHDVISNVTWEEVLALVPALGNKLLVEGIGGSGKTTLMYWTAVEALRSGKKADGTDRALRSRRLEHLIERLGLRSGLAPSWELSEPWYHRVPLFVRLREHADGRLPPPSELPRLIARTALGGAEEWVRRLIGEKRVLFLIDGIDEVRSEGRDALAEDIAAYLRDYEGCSLIATSRPPAVQDSRWADLFGSSRLQVERMAKPEIQAFVRHWYRAYGIVRNEARDERATERLLGQLEAREGLAGLMDTPLLAASICFLNKDQPDELPVRAPELYRQLCRQLVHQLDEDRLRSDGYAALVPALKDLEADDKLYLLAKLAQRMVENGANVLDEDEARGRVRDGLDRLGRGTGRQEGEVLHALQERSGLLRGSSPSTVEFAHNNLRDWLAARGFAEDDQSVVPVPQAFVLASFDLPMLAAAQARSERYRERLIDSCLKISGEEQGLARLGRIMALRCGYAGAIGPSYRAKLERLVGEVLPPLNPHEAVWLAELGAGIVEGLRTERLRDSTTDAACVRCLRLIGGERATAALNDYIKYQTWDVLDELAQAVPPLSIPWLRDVVLGRRLGRGSAIRHITVDDLMHADEEFRQTKELHLPVANVGNLTFIERYPELRSLDVSGTRIFDLQPLAGLGGLERLRLSGTPVGDLSVLRGLKGLRELSLIGTQVKDISPLADLTALESLSLGSDRLNDVSALAMLTELKALSLTGVQLSNIAPIAGLNTLQKFRLLGTKVKDISALTGLHALMRLDLVNTPVSDVSALVGLTALESLRLDGSPVSDISALSGLNALRHLHLKGTKVSDVSVLAHLTELKIER